MPGGGGVGAGGAGEGGRGGLGGGGEGAGLAAHSTQSSHTTLYSAHVAGYFRGTTGAAMTRAEGLLFPAAAAAVLRGCVPSVRACMLPGALYASHGAPRSHALRQRLHENYPVCKVRA